MHTVLFTAGILAVLMACLRRAVMVLLLEQWRAWVFLVLNLVLLAILFTSSFNQTQECSSNEKIGSESKKRRKQCRRSSASDWDDQEPAACTEEEMEAPGSIKEEDMETLVGPYKEEDMEAPRLSKEELNERVEAFIVMFRQHLVLDAMRGSSTTGKHLFERPGGVEHFKFQTCPK